MPMYWTFNCFVGCLYISLLSPQVTFKSWILTSEKKDQVAQIRVRGGGRWWKKTFFSVDVFRYQKCFFLCEVTKFCFLWSWSWNGMHQLARQDEIVLLTKVDKLCEMTKLSPKKYSGKKEKQTMGTECLWSNKGGPHYK